MEDSSRIQIVACFVVATLFTCSQSARLTLIETNSTYASYGYYNDTCNKLLYFGVTVDNEGKIVGSSISVRNLDNDKEEILEKNVTYPALGWANDSSVLVYKVVGDPEKSIFSGGHERSLYTINIRTNEKQFISDVPLKLTGSNLIIVDNVVIYQTGYGKTSQFFKYNLQSRETSSLPVLNGLEIGEGNMAYDANTEMLAFVSFENEKYKLNLFDNKSINTLEISNNYIDQIFFDGFHQRLYYTIRLGKDQMQVLKRVDLNCMEVKTIYKFTEQEEPIKVSPYRDGDLLVSLILNSNNLSTHEFNNENPTITVGINPSRKLFEMSIDE
jgi:hypothetical protein